MSTSSILLSGTMLTRMTTPGSGVAPPDPTVVVRDPKPLVPQDSDRSGDPDVHPVGTSESVQNVASLSTLQCWDHGCNGRTFAHRSSLTKHKKRKGVKERLGETVRRTSGCHTCRRRRVKVSPP
jgi:hypothetical protein